MGTILLAALQFVWAADTFPPASPILTHFDTVATVGGARETEHLLVYGQPVGVQFVAPATVLYADNRGGRIAVVNLRTKTGWEFSDGGGSGPGEFGGKLAFVGSEDSLVWTVSQEGQMASRHLATGELIAAQRYSYPVFCCRAGIRPAGVLTGGLFVADFVEFPRGSAGAPVGRGIRVHDRDGSLLWSYEGVPPVSSGQGEQGRFPRVVAAARNTTVAVGVSNSSEVAVLDDEGIRLGTIENRSDVWSLFIDANDRIWVQSMLGDQDGDPRSVYRVYDRALEEVFTIYLPSILDARDGQIVAQSFDEFDAIQLHLINYVPP